MAPTWLRLTAAIIFVVAWCAPFYLDAASTGDSSVERAVDLGPSAVLIFYVALTLAAGFLIRWPALVLPVVIFVALTPLGAHPEDSDGWTYAGLYAIPSGFLSFPALAFGSLTGTAFLRPRSREPQPRSLLLIPLGLAALISLITLQLIASTNTIELKPPRLSIAGMAANPLEPKDRQLPLAAGGVETCSSDEDQIVDLAVREAPSKIVVDGSLEVHGEFPCDRYRPSLRFLASLERPLGARDVVDNSRGLHELIWTARYGDRLRDFPESAAERFLLSERDGSDAKCKRAKARYIDCTYRRASDGKRSHAVLTLLPSGEFALGPK